MSSNKTTIYDIARLAGVSPASVSRTIHQPNTVRKMTRDKIWSAFGQLGVSPEDLSFKATSKAVSQGTAGPHMPTILLCIPSFQNPFYDEIIDGIQEQLQRASYTLIIYGQSLAKDTVNHFLEVAASVKADGLILTEQIPEDFLLKINAQYPLVQCSEYNPACHNIPYVTIDDYAVTETAIRYLLKQGCESIGFFSAPYQNRYVQNRYRAYKAVLEEAGIFVRSEHVLQVSDFSYERMLSTARGFFRLPQAPDAVFAVSDKHAHAVIKAAQMEGVRVPEDLKVIGFDDTMYATLSTPAITTIAQPGFELGTESAKILLDKIAGRQVVSPVQVLSAHMVFRESV